MAIYVRCPECRTDNKRDSSKCRKCGKPWKGAKGVKYRLVAYSGGKRLPIETFDSLKHAETQEKRYSVKAAQGKLGIVSVPRLCDVWAKLSERIGDRDYKEFKKSWKKDIQKWNTHIEPHIGHMKMDQITTGDVKRIVDRMSKTKSRLGEPFSDSTREQVRKIVARIYNWGRRQGLYMGPNPANDILIRVDNERDDKLTLVQCGRLLEVCDAENYGSKHPQAAAVVKIAVLTGRRRGEICDMRWENIDWETGIYKSPDTKSGDDLLLTMPDDVKDLLSLIGRQDDGPIFTNRSGRSYYYSLDARWREIKKKAELPSDFVFHSLRHSFASAYASSGEGDIYRLKQLLGHKTLAMTMRYIHLFDEARLRDANVVANRIREATEAATGPDASRRRIDREHESAITRIISMGLPADKEKALVAKADLARDLEIAALDSAAKKE
jgi:integrase